MSQLFKLKNGTVLLSTEAPGGVYNSGQLKKIAELCSKELAVVKATEDQRLALFVKESEVEKVVAQLQTMGLGVRNYQAGLHQPIACLGELCEQHEQPALASAMDLTKAIAEIQLNAPLKIGINGCARCCTPCHTFDISILGEPSGYRISLAGKNSQFPELSSFFAEGVPPKELPRLIKKVIELFQKLAEPGETLHSVLERSGVEEFVAALAPYSQDAAHRDDPFASPAADAGLMAAATADEGEELDVEAEVAPADEDFSLDDDFSLEAETPDDSLSLDAPAEASAPMEEEELSFDLEDEPLAAPEASALPEEDNFSLGLDEGAELDEIPIEKEASATLGDDISLTDDLGGDLLLEDEPLPDDDLNIDAALLEEEVIPAASPAAPAKTAAAAPEDDNLLEFESDELSLEEPLEADLAPLEMSGIDGEGLEEEIVFEESAEEAAPLATEADEMSLLESDGLDEIDESAELDPSLQLDTELALLEEPDGIELDDAEGIPDLDGVLAPDALEESVVAPELAVAPEAKGEAKAPAMASNPAAAAAIPEDSFDEDLELESLSDEEESHFEAKLHASIEEESRLLATVESDPNEGDRQAALQLLENPKPAERAKNTERAPAKTIELPRSASKSAGLRFAGLSFHDGQMRLAFSSGAYVDVDLSSLEVDEPRSFNFGELELSVVQTESGFTVELEGMRMFYPREALQSA